jgi:hypothetical protein
LIDHRIVIPASAVDSADAFFGLTWACLLFVIVWFFPNTQQIMYRFDPTLGRSQSGPLGTRFSWRPNLVWAAAVGAALCLGVLAIGGTSEFLYFQF